MKKHLPGHISKTWGFVTSMCRYTPLPKGNNLPVSFDAFLEGHFTTIDRLQREVDNVKDVCERCLKINEDFSKQKTCCTDPLCKGNLAKGKTRG